MSNIAMIMSPLYSDQRYSDWNQRPGPTGCSSVCRNRPSLQSLPNTRGATNRKVRRRVGADVRARSSCSVSPLCSCAAGLRRFSPKDHTDRTGKSRTIPASFGCCRFCAAQDCWLVAWQCVFLPTAWDGVASDKKPQCSNQEAQRPTKKRRSIPRKATYYGSIAPP